MCIQVIFVNKFQIQKLFKIFMIGLSTILTSLHNLIYENLPLVKKL